MERVVAAGIGNGARDAQPGVFVEEMVADDQGGTAAALFMTGLWVKGERDQLSLSWDIVRHYQTSRPTGVPQFSSSGL